MVVAVAPAPKPVSMLGGGPSRKRTDFVNPCDYGETGSGKGGEGCPEPLN